MKLVCNLLEVSLADIGLVGGKAASLGEMLQGLNGQNVRIPHGFVITTDAYSLLLSHNNLTEEIIHLQHTITDFSDYQQVEAVLVRIREKIQAAVVPNELIQAINEAYRALSTYYNVDSCSVAVRSSATAEDLPQASFAGQQETFLHVIGADAIVNAMVRAMASLFTHRALVYRHEQHIDPRTVALAVCVQKMVQSDRACAGVLFTLDTESGFADVIMINGSYGFGELVVQGEVNGDEFWISKKITTQSLYPVIRKTLGSKTQRMGIDRAGKNMLFPVDRALQQQFILRDEELQELAGTALRIEAYYSSKNHRWTPLDIEWAKDGDDGLLYIVQARPETVHSSQQQERDITFTRESLAPGQQPTVLVTGQSIGQRIVHGIARVVQAYDAHHDFQPGDILVTSMTDPDWMPLVRKAAGIITDNGGRTCHAAIVSREMGIPAIVGTRYGTQKITNGAPITIDCSQGLEGFVYEGHVPLATSTIRLEKNHMGDLPIMMNIAQPERAFVAAQLPVAGVGLARIEFIISRDIGVHPLAIIAPEKITDDALKRQIEDRAAAYGSLREYFITKLAEGVGTIAAAFYPRPVIVRWSDFKSNEYRNLLGGAFFEPHEENPMLGWRGASRYVTDVFRPAFALECAAIQRVRDTWGFTNVHTMIPFVRSADEAQTVCKLLEELGIRRGDQGLQLYMMVEIPANVICFMDYVPFFDGFSIGSNDLTQLTLGVDRDASILHDRYNEQDPAVVAFLRQAVRQARAAGAYLSICGEAPATYPALADMLILEGISALSMAADAVVPFLLARQRLQEPEIRR